jgi:hypothetical protein
VFYASISRVKKKPDCDGRAIARDQCVRASDHKETTMNDDITIPKTGSTLRTVLICIGVGVLLIGGLITIMGATQHLFTGG